MTADDDNAYRAPRVEITRKAEQPLTRRGAWRDGPYLVVRRKFRDYPDRCIACNAPADGIRARFSVYYVRSALSVVLVGLLLSPLFLLFVWMLLPKAEVRPGVCKMHKSLHFRARLIPVLIALVGLCLLTVGSMMDGKLGELHASALLGTMAAFWAAMIMAVTYGKVIVARKVDKHFVWLDKVSPDYLQQFPELGASNSPDTQQAEGAKSWPN
jgi:hypothetical protein